METLKGIVKSIMTAVPLWGLIIIGSVILIVLFLLIIVPILSKVTFKKRLRRVAENPDLVSALIKNLYTPQYLLRRSQIIERFAKTKESRIIGLIGMDELWIESLALRKRKKDFQRVLTYAPQKGLFKCFLLGLEKKQLGQALLDWLAESGDFLFLRRLALSGKGESFDGREALDLLRDQLDLVREMTGDPEWASRYFAYKILLYDTDERSIRAIWDGFYDAHPLTRKTIVREFNTEDIDRMYSILRDLYLKDPAFEVRRIAWERIHSDFSGLYSLDIDSLSHEEAFHALELLRDNNKTDENLALKFLESSDLELRSMAATFLERNGVLERLCLAVDLGDQEGLERSSTLLKNSSEVNVTSFLQAIERTHSPATLLVCAKILKDIGDRSLITEVAKKAFRLIDSDRRYIELYRATLESVFQRGNDEALKVLDRELVKRKDDEELVKLVLSYIPERSDAFSLSTLLLFLKDPDSKAKDAVRSALRRMQVALILPELLSIIKADRTVYPHVIRIQVLLLMGELQMPYCLQTILENLPIIPIQEGREFAQILSKYPKDLFVKKAEKLLETPDSKIRSALIACLPSTGIKDFLTSIRKSLNDADPDVRIASIWALVEYNDTRTLNQAFMLLRDPVERVRVEASKALGIMGSDDSLNKLEEILDDENEIIMVKEAVISGLASSKTTKSIDILTNHLEKEDGLLDRAVVALAGKTDKKEITRLIENFKDGSPRVRDKLKESFKGMREEGEMTLVELLRENIASLNPFIAEILDGTGFVEAIIRKLNHRDPEIRREAAEVLSMVGTQAAFRGMVLAARDPNEEVRVQVIKALEKLETKKGKIILDALESDPDRKIRKYTHWALERIKAKSL